MKEGLLIIDESIKTLEIKSFKRIQFKIILKKKNRILDLDRVLCVCVCVFISFCLLFQTRYFVVLTSLKILQLLLF